MNTNNSIVIASSNPGKINEISLLFRSSKFSIVPINSLVNKYLRITPEEKGKSFSENARIKANYYGKIIGRYVIADDSGLVVDSLKGEPGINSARLAETDSKKVSIVLRKMKRIKEKKRTAKFKCVIALYHPSKKQTLFFSGETKGLITHKPLGKSGFTYDPIFFSPELGKTFAQATIEEKNSVSHRARAVNKLIKFLNAELQ
jgi:XTP/dITP diphosphohydrolase